MTPAPALAGGASLAIRGRLLWFDADPAEEGEGRAVRYVEDGLVVVENGLIREVGEAQAILRRLSPQTPVSDHRPHLVMPGFIDPHLHMPQTQVIGSYGTELMEWLAKYTFPEESRYGDPAVAEAASAFLLDELLSCGTTTAGVYCTTHPESVDAFFGEAGRRNMRMVAGKVMMDRNAPEELLDTPETGYEQSKALIGRWNGKGRLSYAITPRFAPTSTETQLEAVEALANEHPDLHVQTHLSENDAEIAYRARGASLVEGLHRGLPALRPRPAEGAVRPLRPSFGARARGPRRGRGDGGVLPDVQPVSRLRPVRPRPDPRGQGEDRHRHRHRRRHQLLDAAHRGGRLQGAGAERPAAAALRGLPHAVGRQRRGDGAGEPHRPAGAGARRPTSSSSTAARRRRCVAAWGGSRRWPRSCSC